LVAGPNPAGPAFVEIVKVLLIFDVAPSASDRTIEKPPMKVTLTLSAMFAKPIPAFVAGFVSWIVIDAALWLPVVLTTSSLCLICPAPSAVAIIPFLRKGRWVNIGVLFAYSANFLGWVMLSTLRGGELGPALYMGITGQPIILPLLGPYFFPATQG
jgi:hypothetical protein